MDDLVQLAERLGKAIAGCDQAVKLREARKAMNGEPGLAEIMKQYGEQSENIARLDAANQPVEVEDKHKLAELRGKLVSSETFKKFTAAQVDYVDMMRKVNEALQSQLADTEQE